jgi:hypothetical protein
MHGLSPLLKLLQAMTDRHRLCTQVWPALLTLLPVFAALIKERWVSPNGIALVSTVFIGVGGTGMLSLVMQDCGRRRAHKLFRRCGGRPGVEMLRHWNTTVDRETKRGLRAHLTQRLGIRLPTPTEERRNPAAADKSYQRAVVGCECRSPDRLSFPLLWQHKTASEFLINGLAARWLGFTIATSVMLWTCLSHSSMSIEEQPRLELIASLSLHFGSLSVMLVSLLMAVTWLFFFTPHRAVSAAWSYDELLLEPIGIGKFHAAGD